MAISEAHSWPLHRLAGRSGNAYFCCVRETPVQLLHVLALDLVSHFAFSAFSAYEQNRGTWVWIFGVLAALYNPIFRVHLNRSTWIGVNWFTVGAIIVAAVGFLRRPRT